MSLKAPETILVGMSDSPKWVKWRNRIYKIKKIGLHHTYREGRTLYHIFSVVTDSLFLRLKFNTENLSWRLDDFSDAEI